MAERIRNFFRFNILPVLPYLRKKNRGTAVNLCSLLPCQNVLLIKPVE